MIHMFNQRYLEQPPWFRKTTLPMLRLSMALGDYLFFLDIQDAYLHVPIHEAHI